MLMRVLFFYRRDEDALQEYLLNKIKISYFIAVIIMALHVLMRAIRIYDMHSRRTFATVFIIA